MSFVDFMLLAEGHGDSQHMRRVSEVNPQAIINSLPEWVLATRDCSENVRTKNVQKREEDSCKITLNMK